MQTSLEKAIEIIHRLTKPEPEVTMLPTFNWKNPYPNSAAIIADSKRCMRWPKAFEGTHEYTGEVCPEKAGMEFMYDAEGKEFKFIPD